MQTTITDAGINAAIQAGLTGPKISITRVKIGSSIISGSASMTDVTNLVWDSQTEGINPISYQIISDKTFQFKITLDESIGNFDIGNIGLFLEDGTMFSITTLDKVETKIKNATDVIGNRRIFAIPIVLSGISGLINVSVMVPDECALPFVQNENDLPNINDVRASFNVYQILFNTLSRTTGLALRTNTGWTYLNPQDSSTISSFFEGYFSPLVSVGTLCYWNPILNQFLPADGLDDTKGFVGIRGSLNNVVNCGVFQKENWGLTPGAKYYANGGQFVGLLTTTPNNWYVGEAIDENTLFLGTKTETILNKTNNLDLLNPSIYKYPTEYALVNYVTPISNTKANIDLSNLSQEGLNKIVNTSIPPINSFYTQYTDNNGQFNASESPNVLYPGTNWNLFFNGEGDFFRTEGGNSSENRQANGIQTDAIRNITGRLGGISSFISNHGADSGMVYDAGAFGGFATGSGSVDPGTTWGFDASRVVPTGSENRPVNRLIRVWKRIS